MDFSLTNLSRLLLLWLQTVRLAVGQTNGDDIDNLYRRIFLDRNAKLRPLRNQNQVLFVDIFVHLSNLIDISEVDQKVEMNGWVNLSWIDELRVWNSSEYDGFELFFPEPGVSWSPRLLLTNSVEKSDIFEDYHTYHFIFANGTTRFYPQGVFRVACNMKMSFFPFDTQHCNMRILTKYLSNYVKFRVPEQADENAAIASFRTHGEWEISHVKQTAADEIFDNESYSVFIIAFDLTRKPTFVVLVVVLPVILLSMISLMVFLLPVESGEKISFSITVLLSLSVFTSFVSDLLPRNSQSLPMLVVYLFALMVLTGLAVVTIILMMASSEDGQLDVINEELSNEISRALRVANLTSATENGNSNNNMASRTDIRRSSSSFRRKNNHRNAHFSHTGRSFGIGGGGHSNYTTTASHINQWQGHEQHCNGGLRTVDEGHASPANGILSHDTGHEDTGLYYYDSLDTSGFSRRRASISSQGLGGSGFDNNLHQARRHSLCTLGLNRHKSPYAGGYFSTFLNRIPKRDKYVSCVFFTIWIFLTVGFIMYTALQ